jgi:hypothetical protein
MLDKPWCPHAAWCVHPCDDDECMLETIEQPNGPATPLSKFQCEAFERAVQAYIIQQKEIIR